MEKTSFSKWYRQLEKVSGSLINEAGSPIAYVMHEDSTLLTGSDLTALLTLHGLQLMGTHHTHPAYEIDSGTLWSLIRDCTEDRPASYMISKFKISCNG